MKTAFIMAAVIAAIALVVVLNVTATTQDGTGEQEKQDDQITSIEGYCGSEGCIIDAARECTLSETRVKDASNATTIISVGEERQYQGQTVCTIGIHKASADGNIQSWSCKVPVAELRDSTFADVEELVSTLASSEHCARQVP